ncbi:uncharacterized protein LOC127976520 [Carassius gibelio]|uniref:uncharacterized protein LOC127976520 n=1 Tax=Carassius gibelio TaxID=101364 RepID=UPI002278312F|nr:uncharacterized protein LOC127976520 [Carassius gibelio]
METVRCVLYTRHWNLMRKQELEPGQKKESLLVIHWTRPHQIPPSQWEIIRPFIWVSVDRKHDHIWTLKGRQSSLQKKMLEETTQTFIVMNAVWWDAIPLNVCRRDSLDLIQARYKTSCEVPAIQITADRRQPICCPATPEQSARNMGRGVTLWLCRPSIRTRWWAGHRGNCLRNSVLTSQTGVSHHSSSTVMRCHLERAVESPHVYMQPVWFH